MLSVVGVGRTFRFHCELRACPMFLRGFGCSFLRWTPNGKALTLYAEGTRRETERTLQTMSIKLDFPIIGVLIPVFSSTDMGLQLQRSPRVGSPNRTLNAVQPEQEHRPKRPRSLLGQHPLI